MFILSIPERTYAHLRPTAFEADDSGVELRMPSESPVATLQAA